MSVKATVPAVPDADQALDADASLASQPPLVYDDSSEKGEGSMSSVRTRDGARATSVRSFAEHLERTAGAEPGPGYLERMWDQTVLVEGDVAVVWTPYDFWLGGEFSHGGVDVITLLRTDEGWRIASFAWSVVPDFESPLPPPRAAD